MGPEDSHGGCRGDVHVQADYSRREQRQPKKLGWRRQTVECGRQSAMMTKQNVVADEPQRLAVASKRPDVCDNELFANDCAFG